EDMRALWAFEQMERPQLTGHWKKFQQWAEEAHLHGEVDFDQAYQEYHDAKQGESEEPILFYSRLTKLAAAVQEKPEFRNFFPRLQKGLQNTLIRGNRKGSNLRELIKNAQEVWGTFPDRLKRKRPDESETNTPRKNPRFSEQSANQAAKPPHTNPTNSSHRHRQSNPYRTYPRPSALSNEERQRRFEHGLCYRCGRAKDRAEGCKGPFHEGLPADTASATAGTEPAKTQQATSQPPRRTPWRKPRFQAATVNKDDQSDPDLDELSDDG